MRTSIGLDFVIVLAMASALVLGYNIVGSSEADSADLERIARRHEATQLAQLYIGTQFPNVEARGVVRQEKHEVNYAGLSAIIVLGNQACTPCQIREMRNLQRLYSRFDNSITIVAIYFNEKHVSDESDRFQLLRLRKISQATYPVLYSSSAELGRYMSAAQYPMMFVLREGQVVSSLVPIVNDDEFSERYMYSLYRRFQGEAMQ